MIKKILLTISCIIFILTFYFMSLINSRNSEKPYNLKILNDFLGQLEEKYHYIAASEVVEFHGTITVRIEYESHKELEIDENLYDNLRAFFAELNTQDAIIEKQPGLIKDRYYPNIRIEFIDITGMDSHYIESISEGSKYNVSDIKEDMYKHWTKPEHNLSK